MEGVVNAEALMKIYGYWPTFHDAVVLSVMLNRSGTIGPEMTAQIDLWEPNPKLDIHVLVTLVFRGIESFILAEFNRENMIDGMGIIPIAPPREDNCRFSVRFDSFYEPGSGLALEMDFQCREIEVVSAAPRI